jgi:hypothetical protein
MEVEFSSHALKQIEARGISKEVIESIIQNPDQISRQDQSTKLYCKLIKEAEKYYLYRVFVNSDKRPSLIITAYKTSKIDKYGYPLR